MNFESEKNVGTTFQIENSVLRLMIAFISKNRQRKNIMFSIEGVRVLVAEDNDLNMEITEFVLFISRRGGNKSVKRSRGNRDF